MNLSLVNTGWRGEYLLGVSRRLVAGDTEKNQKSQFLLSWSASSSRGETSTKINTQRRSFQITASSEQGHVTEHV